MGAFDGSIHLRTEDSAKVRAILEKVAAESKARFLLGPAINGWIAVYPHRHGQDEMVSRQIAKLAGCEVFHLVNHDDDVFAYGFYTADGALADEYVSAPGYSSESMQAAEEKMVGKPEVYAHLLIGTSVGDVHELLRRDSAVSKPRFAFEGERLEEFAAMLGIENARTSYEYLLDGDTDGIHRRSEFVHVPDLADERRKAREKKAAEKEAIRQLIREGKLFAEYRGKKGEHPSYCVDYSSDGFLINWTDLKCGPTQILRLAPPWPKKGEPLGELLDARASKAVSHTGRCLAGPEDKLWKISGNSLEPTSITGLHGYRVKFSDDERFIAVTTSDEVRIVSTEDGITRKIPTVGAQNAIVDTVSRQALIDVQRRLLLMSLDEPDHVRRLHVGVSDPNNPVRNFEQSAERVSELMFSADGNYLFCATASGLRIYDWRKFLAEGEDLFWPEFSYDASYTYALAEDFENKLLFFGGIEGKLRAMSLETGKVVDLMQMPDDLSIISLGLSRDQKSLGCMVRQGLRKFERRGPRDMWLQIWNYEWLLTLVKF